jgi:hypothetical protein
VSAGHLVPTLAKLMLFRLDGLFAARHVFSSRRDGKLHCFRRLRGCFGAGSSFAAVGDAREERQAAEVLNRPFLPVALTLNSDHCVHRLTPARVVALLPPPSRNTLAL